MVRGRAWDEILFRKTVEVGLPHCSRGCVLIHRRFSLPATLRALQSHSCSKATAGVRQRERADGATASVRCSGLSFQGGPAVSACA